MNKIFITPIAIILLVIYSFAQDNNELLEIHKICKNNDLKKFIEITSKYKDLNFQYEYPGQNPTLLQIASIYGADNICLYLIKKGVNINKNNSIFLTALHYACYNCKLTTVELLLKNKANVNAETGHEKLKPIHIMSTCDSSDSDVCFKIIDTLIKYGADINSQASFGDEPYLGGYEDWTPLHFAANKNNIEMVKYLIKKGANINITNRKGKKAISLTDNQEIIKILEK